MVSGKHGDVPIGGLLLNKGESYAQDEISSLYEYILENPLDISFINTTSYKYKLTIKGEKVIDDFIDSIKNEYEDIIQSLELGIL